MRTFCSQCFTFHRQLIVSLALSGLAFAQACSAAPGLTIKQTCKFNGPHTVYLMPGALKISEPKSGLSYICQKPGWRWQIFNEQTKKYYECAPQAFKGTTGERLIVFLHEKLLRASFKQIGQAKILKEPVERYTSPLSSTVALDSPGRRKRFFETALLINNPLPLTVQTAIGKVYGVPLDGLPLSVIYLDELNALRQALATINLTKSDLKPEIFSAPKNCVKVNSEAEVYGDAERDSDVNQLFGPR